MADFNNIMNELSVKIAELAKLTVSNYLNEAKKDAEDAIRQHQADLMRWTNLLAEGQLATSDFEWLVKSKLDLAEMKMLKQKGLALIRIDQFKNSVINLVVDTIFKFVL